MNLKKLGRALGIVAAATMLAMVLQGCSGSDSGVSQDLYDMSQADLEAANAALQAAQDAAAAAAAAAAADLKAAQDAAAAAAAAAAAELETAQAAAAAAATQAAADLQQARDDAQDAAVAAAAALKTAEDNAAAAAAAAAADLEMAEEAAAAAAAAAAAELETAQAAAATANAALEAAQDAADTANADLEAANAVLQAAQDAAAAAATQAAADLQAAQDAAAAAAAAAATQAAADLKAAQDAAAAAAAQAAADLKAAQDAAAAAATQAAADLQAAQDAAAAAATQAADDLKMAEDDAAAANAALQQARDAAQDAARDAATALQQARDAAQDAARDADTALQAAQDAAAAAATQAAADLQAAEDAAAAAATQAAAALQAAQDAAAAAAAAAAAELETAQEALAAAEAARMAAEERLAELTREEEDAEVAQRARVDALGIQNTAGRQVVTTPGVDLNGDGDFADTGETVPVRGSSASVVRGYQGEQAQPTALTLTASREGSMVTFGSTSGSGDTLETLIDFEVPVGSGDDTSGMEEIDLLGGRARHVHLMTDIQAPVPLTRTAMENQPGIADSELEGQRYEYTLTALPDRERLINLTDDANVVLDLGGYAPTDSNPIRYVVSGAIRSGSYNGIPGNYICSTAAGNSCTIELSASTLAASTSGATNGNPAVDVGDILLKHEWRFIPAADATLPDPDYLVYGAWLDKPDRLVGRSYAVALGMGNDLFDASSPRGPAADTADHNGIIELTGKAKYSGSAAGFYAERPANSQGAVSGTFTATAELNADFDAASGPLSSDSGDTGLARDTDGSGGTADGPGAISGVIKDFNRDDDVAVDWRITLETIPLAMANADDDATVTTTDAGSFVDGDTTGSAGGASLAGRWGVQFVGNAGPGEVLITDEDATVHPSGVVGTFGAQRGTADMSANSDAGFVGVTGGFGARRVAE